MPGSEKHYAGRWICQSPADKCKGTFRVYGEKRPCPLAEKCLSSPYRCGQLEFVYRQNRFKKLMITSEPDWNIKHVTRRNEAKAAFVPEEVRAYYREYGARHRDLINQRRREKYSPSLQRLFPGYVPKNAFKDIPPPCGGDCRNCPYDDGCHYLNWDEQMDKKRQAKRSAAKKYAAKRRERMASDPEYAERERAKARAYTKAYRQRKKDIMGVKRKEERPPAPRWGRSREGEL